MDIAPKIWNALAATQERRRVQEKSLGTYELWRISYTPCIYSEED